MRESHERLAAIDSLLVKAKRASAAATWACGALDFGGIGRRIDGDQQVALLDQRAFAEVHGLHGAGHARANVDPLDGFQAAGELVPRHGRARRTAATETGVACVAALGSAAEGFAAGMSTRRTRRHRQGQG